MEKTKKFEDLIVWQKSHQLVLNVYRLTKKYPKEEIYNLVSQMRRSASSIPTNIAEGYRKRGIRDKANYLNISEGSIDELKYQLILSKDLEYISQDEFQKEFELAEEVSKMLFSYRKSLLNSSS
ncbi:MAG: four helix bundle protein [Cyclobacteriaceae bacterium]